MPDIFLSYNREDQATARRFAEAFMAEGLEVWWDTTLRAGEAYDQVTEKALKTARAVVVLWSKRSVDSRWVRAEATLADRQKTLVPVTIEPCERPIMFELTQTAELSHWDGDVRDKAWRAFIGDLRRFVQAGGPNSTASPPFPERPAPARTDRLSICVLPFANMSRDEDQEYFADGISEDIITDLSKVSALSVIARNSAFAFKGKAADLKQVACQLEVTHVLEGSVRKAGNRVRITAQLINGATNDHVWAERWDRDLEDIFALQDEVSEAIVKALKLTLFPEEKKAIEDRGTANTEAYDKYLRARALRHQQGAGELRRAIQIYQEALELDPHFVAAWRDLRAAHLDGIIYSAESDETARRGAAAASAHVLALAPDAWQTHALSSEQARLQHCWAEAEAAANAAVAAAPVSEVLATWPLVRFLMAAGRMSEAAAYFPQLLKADPLSLLVSSSFLQLGLDCLDRPEEAQAEYERSKDLSGDRDIAEFLALLRAMARGDAGGAKAQAQRLAAFETVPIARLDDVAQVFDQRETMLDRLHAAFVDPANQDVPGQSKIALWASAYGDADLGVAAIRRNTIDLQAPRIAMIWHPSLSVARKTADFRNIARELGLYDYWRSSGNWGDFARPVGDDDFEIVR